MRQVRAACRLLHALLTTLVLTMSPASLFCAGRSTRPAGSSLAMVRAVNQGGVSMEVDEMLADADDMPEVEQHQQLGGYRGYASSSSDRPEMASGEVHVVAPNSGSSAAHVAADQSHTALVTEAQGVRLHLSGKSPTGYVGVYPNGASGRYEAKISSGGKMIYLGRYDTAVEAAVAFARQKQSRQECSSSSSSANVGRYDTAVEAAVAFARQKQSRQEGSSSSSSANGESGDSLSPLLYDPAATSGFWGTHQRQHYGRPTFSVNKCVTKLLGQQEMMHPWNGPFTFDTAEKAAAALASYLSVNGMHPAAAVSKLEHEGVVLLLKFGSTIGYKGVQIMPGYPIRYTARMYVQDSHSHCTRQVHLGVYDTAWEAAYKYTVVALVRVRCYVALHTLNA